MQKMIAQASMTYGTRRLSAGDSFEVKDGRHAIALEAVGKARSANAPAYLKLPQHDAITMLRAEYERIFNKRPFMGWSEVQLRQKIAAA